MTVEKKCFATAQNKKKCRRRSESDLAWNWGGYGGRVPSATIFASELAFRCVGFFFLEKSGGCQKRGL